MPAAKLIYKERGVKGKGGEFVQIEQTKTFVLNKIKNVSVETNINKKNLVTRGHKKIHKIKIHHDFRKCLQYFFNLDLKLSKVCIKRVSETH